MVEDEHRQYLRAQYDLSKSPEADPLEKIKAVKILEDEIRGTLLKVLKEARDNGCTWDQIGKALGVSKQAASARYSAWIHPKAFPEIEKDPQGD